MILQLNLTKELLIKPLKLNRESSQDGFLCIQRPSVDVMHHLKIIILWYGC